MKRYDDLSSEELHDVRRYLDRTSTVEDDQVHGWLRRLTSEVERVRAVPASGGDHSMKPHGDALEDGSGSRHGVGPGR
jgi:hypothetical protein